MRVCLVIPAYQPEPVLVELVKALAHHEYLAIVVVDDGSGPAYRRVFDAVAAIPGVSVVRHAINLGKGAALKTGMNFALCSYPDAHGVVTADCDGQHLPEDVLAVARTFECMPDTLVLGTRRFEGPVPFRSRLGNSVTRFLFRVLVGTPISDTQTGLRAVPARFIPQLLKLPSSGYEFELDMLIAAKHANIPFRQVFIGTRYEPGNPSSHFHPLWDSMRIYWVLFRFTLSSLVTTVFDNLLFLASLAHGSTILRAQITGRCGAMLLNYFLVKHYVFLSKQTHLITFPKYLGVVFFSGLISYVLLSFLRSEFGLPTVTAKLAAESALFIMSFLLQRDFVFSRRSDEASTDWDRYYRKTPWTAYLTRRYTRRVLLAYLKRFAGQLPKPVVAELGGGNSCFVDAILEALKPRLYYVVDRNAYSLELLARRLGTERRLQLLLADVLDPPEPWKADVVFSVGLIEHFSPEGTARAIERHFAQVAPGGLVILSFPTPTRLYRLTRWILEHLGLWIFHDERPLCDEEVMQCVNRHGQVLARKTLWPLLLTQRMVVVRAGVSPPAVGDLAASGPDRVA